jgi:hypothetical protein
MEFDQVTCPSWSFSKIPTIEYKLLAFGYGLQIQNFTASPPAVWIAVIAQRSASMAWFKPCRHFPDRPVFPLCREFETIGPADEAAATIADKVAVKPQSISRHVDRIAAPEKSGRVFDMGMIVQPARDTRRSTAVRQFKNCADLQPTKECVETGTAWHESPSTAMALRWPKPTEEKEQVAYTYALVGQM